MLCPLPAAAQYGSGSWSFDNLYHVEENSSPAGSSASSTQDAPLNHVRYSAALGSNALRVGADGSASATAKVKGRVRIVATWTPPYSYGGTSTPAPTPPPTVTVRFTATALANGPSGSTSFTLHSDGTQGTHTIALSSPQVDNGFGDPMVLTYDSPPYNGNLGGKEWQSSALRLKTFSTASMVKDPAIGNWKGEFPLDASMSASLTANASGYVTSVGSDITDSTGNVLYVNTNLLGFGDITGDFRSVALTRARSSNPLRSASDPYLDPKRDDWIEADGTMHGHTRFSYDESTGPGNPVFRPNKQNFTASHSGPWGTYLDYSWSPVGGGWGDPGDTINSSTQQMPRGSLYKNAHGDWKGSASSPTTQAYTYTLQDMGGADGAKATAKYYLMLHDEFERNYPEVVTHPNTNVRIAPGAQWVTSTRDGSALQVYAEQSYGWSVDVSFTGTPAGFVAGQLGITAGGSRNASASVGQSATLTNVDKDYATYLELYDAIKIHTGYLDQWTESGYYGVVSYQVIEPDDPAGGIQAHSPPSL